MGGTPSPASGQRRKRLGPTELGILANHDNAPDPEFNAHNGL